MKRKARITITTDQDGSERKAINAIKAHYGFASDAAAVRRAIIEHAAAIKEPPKAVMPVVTGNDAIQ